MVNEKNKTDIFSETPNYIKPNIFFISIIFSGKFKLMDTIKKLQRLSLISILCKELENHNIHKDEDIAEVYLNLL